MLTRSKKSATTEASATEAWVRLEQGAELKVCTLLLTLLGAASETRVFPAVRTKMM